MLLLEGLKWKILEKYTRELTVFTKGKMWNFFDEPGKSLLIFLRFLYMFRYIFSLAFQNKNQGLYIRKARDFVGESDRRIFLTLSFYWIVYEDEYSKILHFDFDILSEIHDLWLWYSSDLWKNHLKKFIMYLILKSL